MLWTVYRLGPIDGNWNLLRTVEETEANIASVCAEDEFPAVDPQKFKDDWKSAQEAAADKGWEGDFRHEPHVFWLPDETQFRYGFVLKQDNNGTTYVISPQALPRLAELSY